MTIPRPLAAAPALPVTLAALGLGPAVAALMVNARRVEVLGWQAGTWAPGHGDPWSAARLWLLGGRALALGAAVTAGVAALTLARRRRSPGLALTTAALVSLALAIAVELIATWTWRGGAGPGAWHDRVVDACAWARAAAVPLATAGVCAAAWADRGVRVLTPATLGAALLAAPPPPLLEQAYGWAEHDAYRWSSEAGTYLLVPDARLWLVPGALAAAAAAWAVMAALVAARLPPLVAGSVAPRSPAPSLRRLAVALAVVAVVVIAAGLAVALAQGQPSARTHPLELVVPVAVAVAAALLAAALLELLRADLPPRASRALAVAAVLVVWIVAVVAAQTLWARRGAPRPGFTIFEDPWMPGLVGAAVAGAALLALAVGLDALARAGGRAPARGHAAIVALALVVGAATAPWVLGFGTRSQPLDGLRVATLGSAALVNLVAWLALARGAWRAAADADADAPTSAYSPAVVSELPR